MKGKLEKRITDTLKELCVPIGNKGFRYLATAITEVLADESKLGNMTNAGGIYDTVAKVHNTTIQRAERAIRHGIECSFGLCDKELFKKYIGYTNKKPTNRDFIAALAYEIKNTEEM